MGQGGDDGMTIMMSPLHVSHDNEDGSVLCVCLKKMIMWCCVYIPVALQRGYKLIYPYAWNVCW